MYATFTSDSGRGRILAGMPKAMWSGGTSVITTAFAPTWAPDPISTGPTDLGTGADRHVATERRVTFTPTHRPAAQGDPVEQQHIVADHRRLADHDSHAVIDEQPAAQLRTRMDFHAGHGSHRLGKQPGD